MNKLIKAFNTLDITTRMHIIMIAIPAFILILHYAGVIHLKTGGC